MDIVPSSLNPKALPSPAVVMAADGESGTSKSICSLCAYRLAIREPEVDGDSRRVGAQSDEEAEGFGRGSDKAGDGTFDDRLHLYFHFLLLLLRTTFTRPP
jgi:hypothetical protein